jgi:UDP-N-acetylmuramyl tripeptide synthase
MNHTKKTFRFYIALWMAKLASFTLKVLKRNATNFPGKVALTICPDFLARIGKPKTIVGVTGTNGKTTVCNMINDILTQNEYSFMNNKYGSNINEGITTTLLQGASLLGKAQKELAVLEIDERSANKVYPYVTPTYLVCTNLFRDSLMRNAHTEFISDILNTYIPKETIMIENADDLICSHIAENNKKIYFGIDKLPTDSDHFENITRDIRVCPKCYSKLEYDYVRYHHIGKAHCTKCDFKTPEADYLLTNLDLENKKMTVKHEQTEEIYDLVSDNIINIYNMLAVIIVLKQLGLTQKQINSSFQNLKIVETRYSKEEYKGYDIITQLAKGMNPIACSLAFDYTRKQPGNKAVILILDDLHEEAHGSEDTAWQYDTDYEFLNDDSIKQLIIAGPRYLDSYIRCLMADISAEKMVYESDLLEATDKLKLEGIDKIFILHDLYSITETKEIKQKVKELIDSKVEEKHED